ncbi:Bro-N domain-containing protein [Streptacidiphilus sp. ASG 303]|uniref:BRO-N domain-containing protein n=1 Tax=Streptacidiphilus sp. ASG 303 TaxID=2896847 RepID=UPI001E48EA47|nr:Bro-N domain-containing protein [Streptacidiphilus sp. ASG 303]MCD0482249.1 Bro-N domain-containing protein [Streptacidiphilus sp. ASG 303]
MADDDRPVLLRSTFPVTGQPVRVVMIAGEPWFATADVCKVLDRGSPSHIRKLVREDETRVVDLRSATLTSSQGCGIDAGHHAYEGGNPLINVISESGLYTVVMRSRKPNAEPFRAWVTRELLPSVRRGDTGTAAQQARMAETLAEAIGPRVEVVARLDGTVEDGIHLMADGTVHCRHGAMEICPPHAEGPGGPPFGPYYRCPEARRVGICGSREVRGCAPVKLVDVARRVNEGAAAGHRTAGDASGTGPVDTGRLFYSVPEQRVYGTPRQLAEVLRAMRS